MREIEFHEAADLEAVEAIAWYESSQTGLGSQFRLEIEKSVTRILKTPFQFPVRSFIGNAILRFGKLASTKPDFSTRFSESNCPLPADLVS